MIHVVAKKCLTGLPLLMYIKLLGRSRSRTIKNRRVGVGVGVGAFVYRLHHTPGYYKHTTDPQRHQIFYCLIV
jgi:hypothetical protein